MAKRRRTHQGRYVVEDDGERLYVGDDIHEAFAMMRTASMAAKMYKLDEDEEGTVQRILLAFRRGLPMPKVVPF
jgi:hypothetical protein